MNAPSWTDASVREALSLGAALARTMTFTRVSTDSRQVAEGDLYVALVGDRFDGHDFVSDALAKGARGAVVSRGWQGEAGGAEGRAPVYRVEDTSIVRPEDVGVLEDTPLPTLTLVTCYPFDYLGSAPYRFIVRARAVEP